MKKVIKKKNDKTKEDDKDKENKEKDEGNDKNEEEGDRVVKEIIQTKHSIKSLLNEWTIFINIFLFYTIC